VRNRGKSFTSKTGKRSRDTGIGEAALPLGGISAVERLDCQPVDDGNACGVERYFSELVVPVNLVRCLVFLMRAACVLLAWLSLGTIVTLQ
jgi:hypothetical protein